ncbi:MAG: N-acetylmuramoyl-L-alanine amidase [Oscillospiraceae bacterium]
MNLKRILLNTLMISTLGITSIFNVFANADDEILYNSGVIQYDNSFHLVQDDIQDISENVPGLLGDVNQDSVINAIDLISMKKIMFGVEEPNNNSDLNGDSLTNMLDILELQTIVIKQNEVTEPEIKRTICLDAGHYGLYNRSVGVKEYYESNMTWKLHIYLKEELEQYGFNVITTRENQETDRNLVSRGQASAGCDLFISIHSNAVGNYMSESTDYPVAIVLLPDDSTDIDEISTEIGIRLSNTVADVMETKQSGRIWTRLSEDDRNGDGILNDEWYGVMYGAKSVGTPAILLEHSFHTNTRSAKWLLDEDNLHRLAKSEAYILAEYFELI